MCAWSITSCSIGRGRSVSGEGTQLLSGHPQRMRSRVVHGYHALNPLITHDAGGRNHIPMACRIPQTRAEADPTNVVLARMPHRGTDPCQIAYLEGAGDNLMVMQIDKERFGEEDNLYENTFNLLAISQKLLQTVVSTTHLLPKNVRETLTQLAIGMGSDDSKRCQLIITTFLFMRLICPALVLPNLYGLLPGTSNGWDEMRLCVSRSFVHIRSA